MILLNESRALAFFQNIGWPEVLIILLVVLILFGGRKLPELARGLGRGLRIFKKELKDVHDDIEGEDNRQGEIEKKAEPKSDEPPK